MADPLDAERLAAEWMHWAGFENVRMTSLGADEGVDVRSDTALAQVKFTVQPVGRPALQQLSGVTQHEGRQALFFSRSGYTRAAVEWADATGTALFTFQGAATIGPVNKPAIDIERRAVGKEPLPPWRNNYEDASTLIVITSTLIGAGFGWSSGGLWIILAPLGGLLGFLVGSLVVMILLFSGAFVTSDDPLRRDR